MSRADLNSAGLLILSPRQEASPPIRLEIFLTPSDEVVKLRKRVGDLELELLEKTQQLKRTENNLMFEYHVNEQLCDLCKAHDVQIPRRLFNRLSE